MVKLHGLKLEISMTFPCCDQALGSPDLSSLAADLSAQRRPEISPFCLRVFSFLMRLLGSFEMVHIQGDAGQP